MSLKDAIKKRIEIRNYYKTNTIEIIDISNQIMRLCVDENCERDNNYHHLPFKKDVKAPAPLKKEDWDLSEKNMEFVESGLKVLSNYARISIDEYNKGHLSEMLPFWIMFPHYPFDTVVGWTSGLGYEYKKTFFAFIENLSIDSRNIYFERYRLPKFLKENDFFLRTLKEKYDIDIKKEET